MNEKMKVDLAELLPIFEEQLSAGKEVCFSPNGTSMLPFIEPGKDSVVLRAEKNIKKYDVILYRRENGQFVLHRVVGFSKGDLVLCGDHQYRREYGIRPNQVIGTVVRMTHRGKEISCRKHSYRMHARLHVWKQYWYGILKRILARLARILGKSSLGT